jgi:hypothetical protein
MARPFTLDLSKFVQRARGNVDAVIKKVVLDVGTAIIERTPVGDPDTWKAPAPAGYVGGRARGSWMYGNGTSPAADPGTIDGKPPQMGQASFDRVVAGVAANEPASQHFITSTVPYMRRLEYDGWSPQAPAGMVRITVEEYQKFVDEACRGLP